MNIILPTVSLLVFVVAGLGSNSQSQDQWARANIKAKRLAPAAFNQLPQPVVAYLQKRKCLIPQSWRTPKPHNVIRGSFIQSGQNDWAVLCSNGTTSAILVFPQGATIGVLKIAQGDDTGYLQAADGNGTIGYSRAISTVGKKFIVSHYRAYGGTKPPVITHQGIDDAFLEKASGVHYYHRGKWLQLTGAD